MNRVYVVTALSVLAVAGALGGAYQFYFKAKIEQYRQHETQKDRLEKKLEAMESTFSKVNPERLVQEWKEQVNPWFNAVGDEGKFFNYGVEPVPAVPEEVVSPRLYYEEQYNKMMQSIQQEAYPRYIPVTNFGVYPPSGIPNNTATRDEVRQWLQKLKFGQDMIRLLLEHKAQAILQIEVWPDAHQQESLLVKRTVGAQFVMSLEDLARFLEILRTSERYYNVEAIRITNPYLLTSPPPPVTVEMLLTLGWFNKVQFENQSASASASTYSSPTEALSSFGLQTRQRMQMKRATGFKAWWQRFRKNWLPF